MKRLRFLLVAIAFLALSILSASAAPEWMTDLKKAQAAAKEQDKLLLIDFTGSDWCGWCIKLNREVFSQPEFQQYAEKNLVLFEADFPRRKELTKETRAQNEMLAQRFGIEGFPTIVVLNGDGKMMGTLGYMEGGAPAFVAVLKKLSDKS